jgi:Restriction endonuclease NotI
VSEGKKKKKKEQTPANFVSEWFGHRVYPTIVSTKQSVADQKGERCPFLSDATGETRACVKSEAARGVCTISSLSNGPRQDWLVCPYRALNEDLVSNSIRRLFDLASGVHPFVTPAVTLKKEDVREDIGKRLGKGEPVFIYFDKKTSGELSIPGTDRSPEFSFDVTVVELNVKDGSPHIGRFGILEIQTMDFHGSYRDAVKNLRDGLRMHPKNFGRMVEANQWWLAQGVEGPNIANVFKRTFYQMMFKFQLGQHEQCAGCVLAIPQSVWDSWQVHLGAPTLTNAGDGTVRLLAPKHTLPDPCPAWIYVFDTDTTKATTPSPLVVSKVIGTDAPSISHWALDVAPAAALENIGAQAGFLAALSRRLKQFWPELAKTVTVDAPTREKAAASSRAESTKSDTKITEMEHLSPYSGPSAGAVSSEAPDQD